ncbi:Twine-like protein [Sarcoptes scabiei]|uniref:M-phase inducer phosphatase n=1 Tax=Sarcoptes scabiei TaxID=52283 RepID=A0A132ACY7_SARSC|nr:Twine-like protein [Sarcoptes scabiei]
MNLSDSFELETNDLFDDDDFINKALNENATNLNLSENKQEENFSIHSNTKVDVSNLIASSTKVNRDLPKCKLDFNIPETPTYCCEIRDRKRKIFSRRCLSIDLNSVQSSELTPEFNTSNKIREPANRPKDESSPRYPFKLNNNSNTKEIRSSLILGGGIPLQKCFSENHASIMRAVQISSSDPSLIGDFSRAYALPLMQNSKHRDLRSITCHVMADLLQQRYEDLIQSFTIIDCRYPYEYEGGHIQNAINLYTQDHIYNTFVKNQSKEAEIQTINSKRNILIFHCEFSSERGPSLYRFLRNRDRVKNSRVYPNLYYPEIYLLDGGYKEFFQHYSVRNDYLGLFEFKLIGLHLCEPCSYKPMHSKDHEEDLRRFRSACKSFDSKFSTMKKITRL